MSEKEGFRKIEKGMVIDHIPPGNALPLMNLLKIEASTKIVIVLNVDSTEFGKKDIIQIEGKFPTSKEIDLISLVLPKATINIIENWKVKEKRQVILPKMINGIFKCPNLACITNAKDGSQITKFKVFEVSDIKNRKLQCVYCNAYLFLGTLINLVNKSIKDTQISRETIEKSFLNVLLKKGALKIMPSPKEPFILKSGRPSAYFINVGTLTDGEALAKMKRALANFIYLLLTEGKLEDFDFIFGPAYKGINLATLSCEGLSELHGINKRYLYDRKEEKTYGDIVADKIIVGGDHFKEGQKILLIDDVATTGGTKIEALEKLEVLGPHKVVGLVLIVDRQEKMGNVTKTKKHSAVDFIEEALGIKVFSILNSKIIFDLVKDNLCPDVKQYWIDYCEKYGVEKVC